MAGQRVIYGAGAQAGFGRAATVGPRYYLGGMILILCVALGLRAWDLGGASLWTDEALTALRAEAPFEESLKSLLSAGNQTPLYFWSMRLVPNDTDTLLRLPSVLLGLVGIVMAMVLSLRLWKNYELSLWVGALLAVNPFHVWLSRTARPYTLMFVLVLVVSFYFLQLVRGNRSRTIWAGFALSSMMAYATHFTAVALPAAQYVLFAFMLREQVKLFRRWMAAQGIAAIPALIWVYIVFNSPPEVASEWIPHPELRDIPLTFWNLTLGYDGVFDWMMVPGLMIATLGLVFGMTEAARKWRTHRDNLYWLWLIVAPVAATFGFSAVFMSFYVDRYFMVCLPALIFLIVWGWYQHPGIWRIALTVLVASGAYTVLFSFYNGSYRRADWRDVAEYVSAEIQPGDAILLERSNTQKAFMRYYAPTGDSTPGVYLLTDQPDTTRFEELSRRVWVIYRNPNEDVHRMGLMPEFDPFDPALSDMGAWLDQRETQVIAQQKFNGVRVLLLNTRHRLAADSSHVP